MAPPLPLEKVVPAIDARASCVSDLYVTRMHSLLAHLNDVVSHSDETGGYLRRVSESYISASPEAN